MLRLLRTSRWIGFTALVVGAIIAFGLLSRWQWSRAEEKQRAQEQVETATSAEARALGIDPPPPWTTVSVSGEFDPATQVLVRKRPLDGQNGYWVLTALRRTPGDPVWVNRGWFPATGPATVTPVAPAPPSGPVTVTGWWRDPEVAQNTDLPTGMVAAVDPAVLPLPGVPAGYVQLTGPEQDGLVPLPRPESDEGRNISYALQWLLFAAVALVGWWFFLRREAQEDALASAERSTTTGA